MRGMTLAHSLSPPPAHFLGQSSCCSSCPFLPVNVSAVIAFHCCSIICFCCNCKIAKHFDTAGNMDGCLWLNQRCWSVGAWCAGLDPESLPRPCSSPCKARQEALLLLLPLGLLLLQALHALAEGNGNVLPVIRLDYIPHIRHLQGSERRAAGSHGTASLCRQPVGTEMLPHCNVPPCVVTPHLRAHHRLKEWQQVQQHRVPRLPLLAQLHVGQQAATEL